MWSCCNVTTCDIASMCCYIIFTLQAAWVTCESEASIQLSAWFSKCIQPIWASEMWFDLTFKHGRPPPWDVTSSELYMYGWSFIPNMVQTLRRTVQRPRRTQKGSEQDLYSLMPRSQLIRVYARSDLGEFMQHFSPRIVRRVMYTSSYIQYTCSENTCRMPSFVVDNDHTSQTWSAQGMI